MAEFQYADLPEILTLSEGVEILAAMEDEHQRLYDRSVVRVHDALHPIDHVITMVLKRSIANTKAFLLLMDSGNEFAAMPLSGIMKVSSWPPNRHQVAGGDRNAEQTSDDQSHSHFGHDGPECLRTVPTCLLV